MKIMFKLWIVSELAKSLVLFYSSHSVTVLTIKELYLPKNGNVIYHFSYRHLINFSQFECNDEH